MQENILGLQSLPTEDELEGIREAKRIQVQRRVEAERRAAAERELRRKEDMNRKDDSNNKSEFRYQQLPPPQEQPKKQVRVGGWKPMEVASKGSDTDDPMVQQMNIIRGYIKQARDAHKLDEVTMLEDNLKELQNEYWRQQNMAHDLPPQRPQSINLKKRNSPNWEPRPARVQQQAAQNSHAQEPRPVQSPLAQQENIRQMQNARVAHTVKVRQVPNTRTQPPVMQVAKQSVKSPEYDATLNPFEEDETPNKAPCNPFDDATPSPSKSKSTNPFDDDDSPSLNPFES